MENINKYILNEADGDSVEASTALPPQEDVALEIISKNDLVKGSTRILTDKNWELWKPNSQEGLKSIAEGTRWLVKTWWDKEDYTPAENWVYNKWNNVYVIMDRNDFQKRYIFIKGYGGMYTASTTQYSLATWLITNNLNKFIKWFADKDLPFISKRLKAHIASNRIESSDGVLTYPKDSDISYRDRENVKALVIEPGTKRINGYALTNLTSIDELEVPGSVKIIGKYAFSGNNFETLKLNEGLEKIEDGAFGYSHNLKSVVIPRTVKKIGGNAFYQSKSLTSFFIPSTVETVGTDIFYQYGGWNVDAQEPLVTVYCESPSKPAGWDDLWDAWQHIRDQQVKRVKVVWGASKPGITEAKETLNEEDDDNLKLVKDEKILYEDSEWKMVRPITFDKLIEYAKNEETVKKWASKILSYASSTDDIESIENYFYDNKQRKSPYVIILNKKNKINYLFYMSGNLGMSTAELLSNKSNNSIDFEKFIKNRSIDFQNWFKKNYSSLAYDIDSAQQKQKVLKEYGGVYGYPNIEKIEYRAKKHFTKIIIKEETNKIEDYAFNSFGNVKSVEIPESVSVIGDGAFENMEKLSNIFLPKNVKIIGKAAFHYCLNLKKIYCEAPSKPEGWHEDWDMYNKHMGGKHKVVWGASKPSLREEKETLNEEDNLEVIPHTVPEYSDENWVVIKADNYSGTIILPNGETFDENKLNNILKYAGAGYILFNIKSDSSTSPDRVYLYNPNKWGKDRLMITGDEAGATSLGSIIKKKRNTNLKDWFIKTFPEIESILRETMVGYMVF